MALFKLFKLLIIMGVLSNLLFSKVDLELSGKTTIFYQSFSDKSKKIDLFDRKKSFINSLFQINMDLNLGNDFTAKLQGTLLGNLGLHKNIAKREVQRSSGGGIIYTQAYVQKVVDGTTTFKIGRMMLSKKISPFIFSEGWTPAHNTLEAILVKDKTVQDTTLVAAFISKGNKSAGFNGQSSFGYFHNIGGSRDGAMLFTLQNKSVSFLPINYSFYFIKNIDVNTSFGNDVVDTNLVTIHSLSTNITSESFKALSLGVQGGQIASNVKRNNVADKNTIFYGTKLSYKMDSITLSAAYSSVDKGTIGVNNLATGGTGNAPAKSPLYTQMVLNQNRIDKDSKTFVLKGVMKNILLKDKAIVQFGQSKLASDTYSEFDLMYKFKVANIDIFTGYSWTKLKNSKDAVQFVRVWGKYTF